MKSTTKLTTIAAAVGAGALGLSLVGLGAGVGANFVDSLTGNAKISVGTFGCQLSSPYSNVNFSNHRHTATVTLPEIESSAAGMETAPLKVTNTGSMPLVVNWTATTSGHVFDSGAMSLAPVQQNLRINSGNSRTYQVGAKWTTLGNADLGTHGTVTYTAKCTEPGTSGHPNITFWTQKGGTAAWDGNKVKFTMPQATSSNNGAVAEAILTNFPTTLPSSAPEFSTDNYSTGSPRFVIEFADGSKVFGYPSSSWPGSSNWEIVGTSGYDTWNEVLAQYGSATVTGVSLLMDMDQPGDTSTITCINYAPGAPGFGSC